jgi:hypothetical protein
VRVHVRVVSTAERGRPDAAVCRAAGMTAAAGHNPTTAAYPFTTTSSVSACVLTLRLFGLGEAEAPPPCQRRESSGASEALSNKLQSLRVPMSHVAETHALFVCSTRKRVAGQTPSLCLPPRSPRLPHSLSLPSPLPPLPPPLDLPPTLLAPIATVAQDFFGVLWRSWRRS